jgi:hypothetical protein
MSITNNTKKLLGQCDDFCLKPGKIKALKMLDLQTKSTINSICFRVQLQATNRNLPPNSPLSIYCVSEQFFPLTCNLFYFSVPNEDSPTKSDLYLDSASIVKHFLFS